MNTDCTKCGVPWGCIKLDSDCQHTYRTGLSTNPNPMNAHIEKLEIREIGATIFTTVQKNITNKINEIIDHLKGLELRERYPDTPGEAWHYSDCAIHGEDGEPREACTCGYERRKSQMGRYRLNGKGEEKPPTVKGDAECMNCGLQRDTVESCGILVCKPTQSIHLFPKGWKPHEHQWCKDSWYWFGNEYCDANPDKTCCLCNPHGGCELNENLRKLEKRLEDGEMLVNAKHEHCGKPAEPAGWEGKLSDALFKLNYQKIVDFIRQVEREANIASWDDGYLHGTQDQEKIMERELAKATREAKLAGFDSAVETMAKNSGGSFAWVNVMKIILGKQRKELGKEQP